MTILTIRDIVLDIDVNWIRIDVICGVIFAFVCVLVILAWRDNERM